jgi:hypothetical protein
MKEEQDSNVFATIRWSLLDIKSIRPDWSDERVEAVAFLIRRTLEERSIEEGWSILTDLLDMFNDIDMSKK